jgi:hypothetical protein
VANLVKMRLPGKMRGTSGGGPTDIPCGMIIKFQWLPTDSRHVRLLSIILQKSISARLPNSKKYGNQLIATLSASRFPGASVSSRIRDEAAAIVLGRCYMYQPE